jgi:hypothetical protein
MWRPLQALLHIARVGQSRSSVINPLQWTMVPLLFALLAVLLAHGPTWLLLFFAGLICLVVLLLLGAYIYFMIKNPDALRSETYSLARTAIEKPLLGDSLSGLREVMNILNATDAKLVGPGEKTGDEHQNE